MTARRARSVEGFVLQAMLLAGIVAAPLGSVALFLPARRHARRAGTWSAVRRFVLALIGTVVLAVAVAVILRLLGASRHNLVAGVAGVVFASLIWMPVTRRWSARAHMCWASSVFLFVVFLTYALEWTFDSHLGPASTAGGVLLWILEVFAAVLCCAYLWEICDALGTEHWQRRITPATRLSVPDSELPMISLHVPAHNEPPEMVIETLGGGLVRAARGQVRSRVAAVPQRARRSHLRRHHGADPAGGAGRARRLGRVVYHRGRRALAAAVAGRMVPAARGPVLGPRDHAADLRGAQGAAVPMVLRRYPAPADALALDDAASSRCSWSRPCR